MMGSPRFGWGSRPTEGCWPITPTEAMRIIHVTEQIDYAWGGLTYVVPRLCLELERQIGRAHV
jgi:hypothetical protein